MPRYYEQFSWDTAQDQDQINATLSDAAIIWADRSVVAQLNRLKKRGHSDQTLGAILGTETPAERLADRYCRIIDELRKKLIEKLRTEELVALAYTATTSAGAPRERIHPGRWRVLVPDFTRNTARGGGLELFDVIVTTPRNSVLVGPVMPASLPFNAGFEISADTTFPIHFAFPIDDVASAGPAFVAGPSVAIEAEIMVENGIVEGSPATKLVLSINEKTFRCGRDKRELTKQQFELLHLLATRLKQGDPVVSTREINAKIFRRETLDDATRNLVMTLRNALAGIGAFSRHELVQTRPQQGYTLKLDASEIEIE